MAEEEIDRSEDAAVEAPDVNAAPEQTAASSSDAAPTPEAEVVAPKERRQRARAARAARVGTRPSRSPEERQGERDARRAQKAQARQTERQRARAKAAATESATPPAAREHEVRAQKTRQGIVVSDRADKTITVRIDISRRHRRYEKIVRTSNTLHAHDERNDAHIGDTVIVRECRPLSRTKRWRLIEVLERAK